MEQMKHQLAMAEIAEIAEILSEFYKFPTEDFYQHINNEDIQLELKGLLQKLELPYDIQIFKPFADFEEMKRAYMHTFVGIDRPAAVPVESVYKVWTTDESASMNFAKSKGYLMGDSALHIQYLLEQFQLEIPRELGKKPDHLAVLFELFGYLIIHQPPEDVLAFVKDHFDWLDDFKAKMTEIEGHEFYLYITELSIELLKECKQIIVSKK